MTKDTKRTRRYDADPLAKEQPVQLIYIQAADLQLAFGHLPKKIRVVIEEVP